MQRAFPSYFAKEVRFGGLVTVLTQENIPLAALNETSPLTERTIRLISSKYYRKGYCHARQDQLAEKLGCSTSSLQRAIHEAEVLGLLNVTPRDRMSNIMTFPPGVREAIRQQTIERSRAARAAALSTATATNVELNESAQKKPATTGSKVIHTPNSGCKATPNLRPSVSSRSTNSNASKNAEPARPPRQGTENALLRPLLQITHNRDSVLPAATATTPSQHAHLPAVSAQHDDRTPAAPTPPAPTVIPTPAASASSPYPAASAAALEITLAAPADRWDADVAPFLARQKSRLLACAASPAPSAVELPLPAESGEKRPCPATPVISPAGSQRRLPREAAVLIATLIAVGVHPTVAERLVRIYPDRIEPSLRLLELRAGIRDKAAWIVNAIRENYAISLPVPGSEFAAAEARERERKYGRSPAPLAPSDLRRRREADEAAARAANNARVAAMRGSPEMEAAVRRARERVYALSHYGTVSQCPTVSDPPPPRHYELLRPAVSDSRPRQAPSSTPRSVGLATSQRPSATATGGPQRHSVRSTVCTGLGDVERSLPPVPGVDHIRTRITTDSVPLRGTPLREPRPFVPRAP